MNFFIRQMVLQTEALVTSVWNTYGSHSVNNRLHGGPNSFLKFTRQGGNEDIVFHPKRRLRYAFDHAVVVVGHNCPDYDG